MEENITAINYGVKEAKGELFLILDSDDSLPKDSLEKIQNAYKKSKEEENFGGVCGLMGHHKWKQNRLMVFLQRFYMQIQLS